jgi:hypothetical protein
MLAVLVSGRDFAGLLAFKRCFAYSELALAYLRSARRWNEEEEIRIGPPGASPTYKQIKGVPQPGLRFRVQKCPRDVGFSD